MWVRLKDLDMNEKGEYQKGQNEYYKKFKEVDAKTSNWRNVASILPKMVKYLDGCESIKILDLGCGAGAITHDVYQTYGKNNEIIGLDPVSTGIKSCQERFCNGNTSIVNESNGNKLTFVEGDGYSLPFEDESFDLVYSHMVLIHMEFPIKALNEMKRVLKRGNNTSQLIVCDSELRSLLFYPINPYQEIFTDYFNQQCSEFTKKDFGLGMKSYFLESNKEYNAKYSKFDFELVPWCVSNDEDRERYARMFIERLEVDTKIKDRENIIEAWKNWSQDPTGVWAMFQGFMVVTY